MQLCENRHTDDQRPCYFYRLNISLLIHRSRSYWVMELYAGEHIQSGKETGSFCPALLLYCWQHLVRHHIFLLVCWRGYIQTFLDGLALGTVDMKHSCTYPLYFGSASRQIDPNADGSGTLYEGVWYGVAASVLSLATNLYATGVVALKAWCVVA